jgi:hypothetical protein
MKLTILPSDKSIGIDGAFLIKIQQDLSWIPSNIHAVQWWDDHGEIEYNDGKPNERIEELGIYQQSIIDYENEKNRIADEIQRELELFEQSRNYWNEFRYIRNERLTESDWTQLSDNNLTEEQREQWTQYRILLRDLSDIIEDPKPLVLDENHPDWPVRPWEITFE